MELLNTLYKRTFGKEPADIIRLQGDGSDRQIFRLNPGSCPVIGISSLNIAENRAFIAFSRHFKSCGLPVPSILAVDETETAYLETDLGDNTLYSVLRQQGGFTATGIELYKQVLSWLPRFQIVAGRELDYSYCYQQPVFGVESMRWDFHYFINQFLERFYSKQIITSLLEKEFEILLNVLLEADMRHFLYRDFQSRNIMIVSGSVYFIDYQSGRKGALQYDLASLLYDAKAKVPEPVRQQLIDWYLSQLSQYIDLDSDEFKYYFYPYTWMRIMQALGAYGYLSGFKGKTGFLGNIPPALQNIATLLERPTVMNRMPELYGIFERLVNDECLQNMGIQHE